MSKIGFHGRLTSMNCLISSRWELKIAGYGLDELYQTQHHSNLQPTSQQQLDQNGSQRTGPLSWFSDPEHSQLEHQPPSQSIFSFGRDTRRSKEMWEFGDRAGDTEAIAASGNGHSDDEDRVIGQGGEEILSSRSAPSSPGKQRNSNSSRFSSATPSHGAISHGSGISDAMDYSGFEQSLNGAETMPLLWTAPECLHLTKTGGYEAVGNQRGDLYRYANCFLPLLSSSVDVALVR